jgi:ATP-dependent RNA helicase DeaD
MGFIEDIETVLEKSRPERRIVLFSATMPQGILSVAKRHFGSYEIVEDFSEAVATELADQVWLEVREGDRLEALCRVIDAEEDFYGIVFTSTRVEADRLSKALEERGYGAEALHGEITQEGRERILGRFRDRRATILVATDVAARGIDIEKLSHVVNWSLPHDPESYLHRVGRTGRAGNAGTAITFVTPEEYRKLFRFRRAAGSGLKKGKVPEIAEVIEAKRDRLASRIIARAASFALHGEGEEALPAEGAALAATAASSEAAPGDEAPAKAPAHKAKASRKAAAKHDSPEAVALWAGLSEELLARLSPKDALAAVLFEAFGGELDPARYREIQDASVDAAATARLFIGVGKAQGANPRSLAALIKRLSGIPDRLVGGIEVYEGFSFANVPFEAAEKVIAETRRSGGLPPVRLATPRAGEGRPGSQGPRGPRPAYGQRREGGYQKAGPGGKPYPRNAYEGPEPRKGGPYKGGKPGKSRDSE